MGESQQIPPRMKLLFLACLILVCSAQRGCGRGGKRPKCDDGSKPTCSDGNRPACADGTTPTKQGRGPPKCGDGSKPACSDGNRPDTCADGSTPTRRGPCSDGTKPSCGGADPVCPDGSALDLTSVWRWVPARQARWTRLRKRIITRISSHVNT